MVPSLLPSLSLTPQPVLYVPHRVGLCVIAVGLTAIGRLGTFRPDLHVALRALRAFLFTSLQSAGQPDACSPRLQQQALGHTTPTGASRLAPVLWGVPAGVLATRTMGVAH